MANSLSHEEIAQRFVNAKVFDFGAMGKLIAELGPELAARDQGWHGINVLACMMPPADVARLVGSLRSAALTAAVIEGAVETGLRE